MLHNMAFRPPSNFEPTSLLTESGIELVHEVTVGR